MHCVVLQQLTVQPLTALESTYGTSISASAAVSHPEEAKLRKYKTALCLNSPSTKANKSNPCNNLSDSTERLVPLARLTASERKEDRLLESYAAARSSERNSWGCLDQPLRAGRGGLPVVTACGNNPLIAVRCRTLSGDQDWHRRGEHASCGKQVAASDTMGGDVSLIILLVAQIELSLIAGLWQ